MPDVPRHYLTFGTVLHACLERWCSADEHGRVPTPKFVGVTPGGFTMPAGPLIGQFCGAPVNIFPLGWEEVFERSVRSRVTPNEAALIRRLVEQAVERGLVQRGDGRVLERELRLPVIEGVDLVGFVDVFKPAMLSGCGELSRQDPDSPPQIHDHKTFGESSTRFLKQADPKSPNYLGADQQLLTYAAATSLIDDWDGPVVVRHNQFPKFDDPRGPRSVEATVPAEVWAEHWEKIQATAARLLQVRDIKKWDDVPGPYGSDVCQKYGGCPFREICGKRTTLDGFRASIERRKAEAGARPNLSTAPRRRLDQMTNTNDIFARARRGAAQPAQPKVDQAAPVAGAVSDRNTKAPSAASNPTLKYPTEAAAYAAAAQGINGGVAAPAAPAPLPGGYVAPPWANPACTACHGLGFNSKGRPCPICDALAKRSKRPTSSMYLVEGSMQDGFTAVQRPDKVADLFALCAPESWSSRAGISQLVQPKPAEVSIATKPRETAAVSSPSASVALPIEPIAAACIPGPVIAMPAKVQEELAALAAPVEAEEKRGRGRPKAGITLLIGCAQIKGPDRPSITVQELLQKLGVELAKDMGVASYWELDAFKRRDRIRQRAEQIAEGLGRTVLLVPGIRDPDADSLVGALLPHADLVIEGVR
jgi:hypothetical protein